MEYSILESLRETYNFFVEAVQSYLNPIFAYEGISLNSSLEDGIKDSNEGSLNGVCLMSKHGKKKGSTHLHRPSNKIYLNFPKGGYRVLDKGDKPEGMTFTQWIRSFGLSEKKAKEILKQAH